MTGQKWADGRRGDGQEKVWPCGDGRRKANVWQAAHCVIVSELAEGQHLRSIEINGSLFEGGVPSAPLVQPSLDLFQLHRHCCALAPLCLSRQLDRRRTRLVAVEDFGHNLTAQLGLRCLTCHSWVVRHQVIAADHRQSPTSEIVSRDATTTLHAVSPLEWRLWCEPLTTTPSTLKWPSNAI
eukprot:scaffold3960_cov116-Isochrysis_galbana.AAC.8